MAIEYTEKIKENEDYSFDLTLKEFKEKEILHFLTAAYTTSNPLDKDYLISNAIKLGYKDDLKGLNGTLKRKLYNRLVSAYIYGEGEFIIKTIEKFGYKGIDKIREKKKQKN